MFKMDTTNSNKIVVPKSKACHKKLCETTRNKITLLAIGALIGFLVCMGYLIWFITSKIFLQDPHDVASQGKTDTNKTNLSDWEASQVVDMGFEEDIMFTSDFNAAYIARRQSLYVGVLTLETYLDTRATVCNETWGQNTKISKLEFYAEIGDDADSPHHDRVVEITDTASIDAWHTEKSFLMLESICANQLNNFDWFLRTVDDSYINVDSLWHFLDNLDKSQELLLGHPTLPIDDSSYTALNGRSYCLGGPGLVFSRPVLKNLCPNLKQCRKTMSHLPADVAIAKCAIETIGVECTFIPEMQNYFMHSFEKNKFHLLNEFVNAKEAFSYHPLKSNWMMRSLHKHIMKRNIKEAIIQLDDLKLEESYLEELLVKQDELSNVLQNDSPPASHTGGDEFTTFYTRDNKGLSAESCLPSYDLVNEEIMENNIAEHFAKTSVQWGHLKSCHEVLSAYHTLVQDKSFRTVDMICSNLSNPADFSLARTVMYQTLGRPSLLAQKHWKTSNCILILVQARTQDLAFIDFVLRVSKFAGIAKSNIVLNVIDLEPSYYGSSQSEKNDESSKFYLDKDLKHWYETLNIHLNIYQSRGDKPMSVLYSDILFKLSRSYPDATVLFTSVNLQFDLDFMLRCRTIVRKGVQVYNPLPVTSDLSLDEPDSMSDSDLFFVGSENLEKVLKRIQSRPLCMHIKDFLPERNSKRNRRNKHNRRMEPLKVNSAFDSHLAYV